MQIRPIALPLPALAPLRLEAAAQGYRFLERLVAEWDDGIIRFDGPGERLLGAFADLRLIGVGGISRDPFVTAGTVGRLRHLYILQAKRRQGVGSALIDHLLQHGRGAFDQVRLRTDRDETARFYIRRGFLPVDDPNASHALVF